MSDNTGTRWKRKKKNTHKWKRIAACTGVALLVGSYFYFNSESKSESEAKATPPLTVMPILGKTEAKVENGLLANVANPTKGALPADEEAPSLPTSLVSSELQNILMQHWAAMGGMRNWSKVDSIRLNGSIERDGQLVDICIVKKRPNQIRATVTLPLPGNDEEKLQVIRAHDGNTAWTATRVAGAPEMIKEELPPEAAGKLLADAGVLPPLIKLWREGVAIELLGTEVIAGQDAYKIKTAIEAGQQYTFYLSSESYLLLAYDSTDKNGSIDRTSISDFMKEAGVLIPRSSVIESTATGTSTMRTKSVQIGVGIYKEYFEPGGALRTANAE